MPLRLEVSCAKHHIYSLYKALGLSLAVTIPILAPTAQSSTPTQGNRNFESSHHQLAVFHLCSL